MVPMKPIPSSEVVILISLGSALLIFFILYNQKTKFLEKLAEKSIIIGLVVVFAIVCLIFHIVEIFTNIILSSPVHTPTIVYLIPLAAIVVVAIIIQGWISKK